MYFSRLRHRLLSITLRILTLAVDTSVRRREARITKTTTTRPIAVKDTFPSIT
jgi:hypothetical protein